MPRKRPFATPAELEGVGLFFGVGTVLAALDTAEYWLFLVAAFRFALAALGYVQTRRGSLKAQREAAGLCVACGYDLRGTPERCPEYGAGAGDAGGAVKWATAAAERGGQMSCKQRSR